MKIKQSLALVSLLLLSTLAPMVSSALRIDDTHYRFCVMDDAEITDYAAVAAENNEQLPTFVTSRWKTYDGVLMNGTKTEIECQNHITSMQVLMTKPYDGSELSMRHEWRLGYNGSAYLQTTNFYITVQAPSGVSFSKLPSKLLTGDDLPFKGNVSGTYPTFSGNGYFDYTYISSDHDVVTFAETSSSVRRIKAMKPGKATITVRAYAKNKKYSGSYYIGEASTEIEVVDNLDPADISVSTHEIVLDKGENRTLTATLTPEDARTTVTWTSSNSEVASVKEGVVTAVSRGNAVISANTSNGLSDKCYVTVLDEEDYSEVCIHGLYYNLNRMERTATVVPPVSSEVLESYISGEVTVPGTVEFHNHEYTVTAIGGGAFADCEITAVHLPETITSIGPWAFFQTPLEIIEFPSDLREIKYEAFFGTKLEWVVIGPNVKVLGEGAFANCRNLKAIYVDEANPYYIRYNNCVYNASMTKLLYVPIDAADIELAESLEVIAADACFGNDSLVQLNFPASLLTIGYQAFRACEKLEKVIMPNSLIEICDSAFDYCKSLREITLGDKLKTIGENAFGGTKLLGDCLKLIKITALNPPTANQNSFYDYSATLLVPLGRTTAYKKDPVWGKFAKITDNEMEAGAAELIINTEGADIPGNLYNMNGILLKRNATEEDLNLLSPGVYFMGNKKIMRRP